MCPAACRGGESRQTAPRAYLGETVVITFPLHPMVGRSVVVVKQTFRRRGRSCVTFDAPPGHMRTLPLEWTDREPRPRTPVVKGRVVLVDVGQLLTMTLWIDERMGILTAIKGRSESPSRGPEASRQRFATGRRPADDGGGRGARCGYAGAGRRADPGGAPVDRRDGLAMGSRRERRQGRR